MCCFYNLSLLAATRTTAVLQCAELEIMMELLLRDCSLLFLSLVKVNVLFSPHPYPTFCSWPGFFTLISTYNCGFYHVRLLLQVLSRLPPDFLSLCQFFVSFQVLTTVCVSHYHDYYYVIFVLLTHYYTQCYFKHLTKAEIKLCACDMTSSL